MKKLAFLLLLLFSTSAHATVNEVVARNDYTVTTVGGITVISFPYTFRILSKSDIRVLINGVVKTVDTDYSVSGVGDSGGGLVILSVSPTPIDGSHVTILRSQPLQQASAYTLNEGFPATRLMADLDKNIMVDQMQEEKLRRAITLAPNSILSGITIADPVASQCLKWNAGATQIVSDTCSVGGSGGTGGTSIAKYLLSTPDSALPNAQSLSTLNSGAMLNTISTGLVSIYTGTSCTNSFVRGLSAAIGATCAQASLASDTTGTLTVSRGGTGVTTGTSTRVPYWATTTLGESASFVWNDTSKTLIVGAGTPSATPVANANAIFATSTGNTGSNSTARFEVFSTNTSASRSALHLVRSTAGAMSDGFGVRQQFTIRDGTNFDNVIAQFTAARSLADDTGTFTIETAAGGLMFDRIVIDSLGGVTIGSLTSGGTSCVQVNSAGKLALSGAACGAVALIDAAHGGTNVDSSASTGLAVVTAGTWTFSLTPTITSLTTTGQGALVLGPYGVSSGNTGELRFMERLANGSNYVAFRSPDSIAANIVWTLPAIDSTGSQCLASNGSAVLSWAACSAGSGTGLSSLNGLTGATQVFTNDTNVTMVSSGTAHQLTWAGTLSASRGGLGVSTAGSTGVPSVLSGTWSVSAQLPKSLGGTGGVGGTAGHVAYWGATTLTGDASFTWDPTNLRMAIGTGGTGAFIPFAVTSASTSATARFESQGGSDNQARTALELVHTRPAGEMANGFAVYQDFILRDITGVDNRIGRVIFARSGGSDAISEFGLQTANAASGLGTRFFIDNLGNPTLFGRTTMLSTTWSTPLDLGSFPLLADGGMIDNVIINGKHTGRFVNLTGTSQTIDGNNTIAINIYKGGGSGSTDKGGVAVSHLGIGSGDNYYAQAAGNATQYRDSLYRGDLASGCCAPTSGGVGPPMIFSGYMFNGIEPSSIGVRVRDLRTSITPARQIVVWSGEGNSSGLSLQNSFGSGRTYGLSSDTSGNLSIQEDTVGAIGMQLTVANTVKFYKSGSCRQLDFATGLWNAC